MAATKKKRVVLVQNWPQVCSRMVQLPPEGEKPIKKQRLPARHFFGSVAHLARRLPEPAQPARWLKTRRYSHLSERRLERWSCHLRVLVNDSVRYYVVKGQRDCEPLNLITGGRAQQKSAPLLLNTVLM